MDKFLKSSLKDVVRLCENGFYDYIIIGSGMGGGVLAQSLLSPPTGSPKARVLLIERGGAVFNTHCLNAPRPHWSHKIPEGPSQDNDIVYRALKEPAQTVSQASYQYVGGDLYCLGGRGNVWGLYTPSVHPDDLHTYFPPLVASYLTDGGGYDRAYRLLSNNSDASLQRPYPRSGGVSAQTISKIGGVIAALDKGTEEWGCSFTTCPLAAEFVPADPDNSLYQFPMGAFSPVNWILDRVYNRDERLTVLVHTRVMTVNRDLDGDASVIKSITARDEAGVEYDIPVRKAKVILAAGTLGSPSIALRSGLGEVDRWAKPDGSDEGGHQNLVGRGLMDHDIFGTRFQVLRGPSLSALGSQPLKLNCWVKFGDDPVLVNMAVNADTFLNRSQMAEMPTVAPAGGKSDATPQPEKSLQKAVEGSGDVPKTVVQVVFCHTSPLEDANRVLNRPEDGVTVQIVKVKDNSKHVPAMQRLAQAVGAALGMQAIEERKQVAANSGLDADEAVKLTLPPLPRMNKSSFGMVSHEVGTMRMGIGKPAVVDENLRFNGVSNLYVCDLSVFPVCPGANPSLTLVALAQRLAEHLIKVTCDSMS